MARKLVTGPYNGPVWRRKSITSLDGRPVEYIGLWMATSDSFQTGLRGILVWKLFRFVSEAPWPSDGLD